MPGHCPCLALQVEHFDQENPGETVVGNDGHQVVQGGDQGTGSHSGVDVNLLEKHGDGGAGDAG